MENLKLFRKYNPESAGPKSSKYLSMNENSIHSQHEFFQIYLPKLRLARVYGFEGLKKISFEINNTREELGLKPIELSEYFADEIQ